MPEYTVESPLLHDGDNYAPGDSVEMSAKQAQPLLDVGVLTVKKTKQQGSTKTDNPAMNANDTIAAIKAAEDVATLDALVPETEARKTVLEAAEAKRAELEATD